MAEIEITAPVVLGTDGTLGGPGGTPLSPSAVSSSTRSFYINTTTQAESFDWGPTWQKALDEGFRRIHVYGGTPCLIKTPVFYDNSTHEGMIFHISGDGRTPILFSKELPTVANFIDPTVKFGFFVNQKRESLVGGVVTFSTGSNAAGGLSTRLVVEDGVMFTAEEEKTGAFYTNKCGIKVGVARVQSMKYFVGAFGYGEGNSFDKVQAPLVEGGILFYQPEGGDSNYFNSIEINSKCIIWWSVGARGGEAVGCVNGGFHLSQCRAISITSAHSEGYSNDPWVWIDRSEVILNGFATSPENAGKEASRGIVIEDSAAEERRGSTVYINGGFYTNLAVEPEKTAIPSIEIVTANPSTRIIARGVTKGTKVSGIFEYNPTRLSIVSPVEAIENALIAGRVLIASGSWELAKSGSGEWHVTAPAPLNGITTPRALGAPTVGNGPSAASSVIGTLTAAEKYEYVCACLDADGNYSTLSAAFVREVSAQGTTHALYTLPTTPCVLRIWRKKGEGGVKTEATAYVDIPLGAAQSLIYDTGAYCNQTKWITAGLPQPETVAAVNTTWESLRFAASGARWGYGKEKPNGLITAPQRSIYFCEADGELYVKKTGAGNEGWVSLQGIEGSSIDSYLALCTPIYGRSIIPNNKAAIGTALMGIFGRVVIPKTGKLHDFTVFNGATVNGNHVAAIFDTGQTKEGKYTPLWQSGEVAAAGAEKPQVIADPNLAVVAGQEVLFAVLNTGTTHQYGSWTNAAIGGWYQLPANFIPSGGGAEPKTLARHTFAEAKFSALSESELQATTTTSVQMLARVV